tara:strand:- start:107 stop:304 length:198 start_codon:yes stop_codon:yes gene_type:complete
MQPKVKELIKTIKKLIYELEAETSNQSKAYSSIDPFAFDVDDVKGYSGQEYGGFPEPIMKMEDEF